MRDPRFSGHEDDPVRHPGGRNGSRRRGERPVKRDAAYLLLAERKGQPVVFRNETPS